LIGLAVLVLVSLDENSLNLTRAFLPKYLSVEDRESTSLLYVNLLVLYDVSGGIMIPLFKIELLASPS
jgi:hypothetical protein